MPLLPSCPEGGCPESELSLLRASRKPSCRFWLSEIASKVPLERSTLAAYLGASYLRKA